MMHSKIDLSKALCAISVLLGLPACCFISCRGASAQAAGPDKRAQFEEASMEVPAGNSCVLHPQNNTDPQQSLSLRADADGVLRFLAVRATLPNSVKQLTLDCNDEQGRSNTYTVDLRSEETFAARPFDPVRAGLTLRPALNGDPLGFTREQLLVGGYGLRPDPREDPEAYQAWLDSVRVPMYELRTSSHSRPPFRSALRDTNVSDPSADPDAPDPESVYLAPATYWIGAILQGSYKKGTSSSLTYGYVDNQAYVNVPTIYPGGDGAGHTALTIWDGLGDVFQTIVDVEATTTAGYLGVHRQNFYNGLPKDNTYDVQGVDFTPKSGDKIFLAEWYCDSKGNLDMLGGYGCTNVVDVTQNVSWTCNKSDGSNCASYPIKSSDLANGILGQSAEYIIENDTAESFGNCPKATKTTECYDQWVDISPVTMTGDADVFEGATKFIKTVTTSTDPVVQLQTDISASIPVVQTSGHMLITLPTGGIKWDELLNNIHYWNGTNFNSLKTPQGTSNALPGVIFGCGTSIAVGPNSRGLTSGTPWMTGCHPSSDGNYAVYQMQTGGAWVQMQSDVAQRLAVSPVGNVWALNAAGEILYWNGSKFVENAQGVCARSIGVGPDSRGLTMGTPWIVGCHPGSDGNYSIYQMQTGGKWVEMESDIATEIAVSPEGNAWALNKSGEILYWNGSKFVENDHGGCASSIGVGPNSRGLTMGTPWITGCGFYPNSDHSIYQMQTGGAWVNMQNDVGQGIAVSPEGNPWVVSTP
jgi:hypothetical protein